MRHRVMWGLLALFAPMGVAAQTTYYVNGACGDDAWSGLSPVCQAPDGPKKTISPAVDLAASGDTVIVAPGTYLLTDNIGIYEPIELRSSNGPYLTVLEGQGDHSRAVFVANLAGNEAATLCGFTVRGFAGPPAPIWIDESRIVLVDCRVVNNSALFAGGIGGQHGARAAAINCTFQNNAGGEGAVFWGEQFDAVNCTLTGNSGSATISAYGGNSTLTNTVIRGSGPHFYDDFDGIVTYSNIEGGYPGDGNIDADPLFVDEAAGNLRLTSGSPCIDAGSNPAVPEWLDTDIDGLPRFIDDPATPDTGLGSAPLVDMGAHEFQPACYPDFTADGALDLFDFLAFVNAFNAADPAADCDGNGILDLFDFLCFVNAFNEGC
jgi:hypothetical protein